MNSLGTKAAVDNPVRITVTARFFFSFINNFLKIYLIISIAVDLGYLPIANNCHRIILVNTYFLNTSS